MEPKVVIIGGGVCGLAAARQLHRRGIPFLLIDERKQPGGRLQTQAHKGYLLDEGFQILNTAYPEFNRQQINIDALGLKNFASGAKIFINGKVTTLADPDREKGAVLNAVLSPAASWSDLFRMRSLKAGISAKSPEELFAMPPASTLEYLRFKGFSQKIIRHFLKPFYSGIFLESELDTDASMFAFVFSMFARGHAALPAGGIQALPELMLKDIPAESVITGISVAHAESGRLLLANGREINVPHVLFATGTRPFNPVRRKEWSGSHHTTVLYFSIEKDPGLGTFIGLNGRASGRINNFCIPSAVQASYAGPEAQGRHLLSVSLIPGLHYAEGMEAEILNEFRMLTGFKENVEFLKAFNVPGALPHLESMRYEPEIIPVFDGAWASGDFAAYPSLNAALRAGYLLAQQVS